ncbi:MAG TPA: pantetheine-phosphate adenylyltransferase [Candidatus Limnocylindrales bacterium]|nr:pantetheine-phosphate adenylyltransferase [Candidatus Limnocylindrales bacterium]
MQYKFQHSVVGGTFDRFHVGHKKLFTEAFKLSDEVIIGISTSKLYSNKPYSHIVEDYQARKTLVENYLKKYDLSERSSIVPIDDIYGNTLSNVNIEAIFVTDDTISAAQAINAKRLSSGFAALKIEKVEFVLADDLEKVSSERIRKGEIDRDGNSYHMLFFDKKRLILPEELRSDLKKPFGKVIKDLSEIEKFIDKKNMLFAVGDIIVMNLYKMNINPDISIIDYKTRRHALNVEDKMLLESISKKENVLNAENTPGTIERRAVGIIRRAFEDLSKTNRQQMIIVDGEEDLLTLPIIALSPLDSIVLYGQPDKGIVMVKVTEKKKKEVKYFLSKMR